MNLIHLKYFITVVEEKNLTRAAELLYITQPTLSRVLAKLSDEMGTPLFNIRGRRIYPTSSGMTLYAWAKDTLVSYDKLLEELAKCKLEENNSIAIAISGPQISRPLLVGFQRAYPEYSFTTVLFNRRNFPDILDNDDISFALTTKANNPPGLESFLIARKPFYAILPNGHPLSKRKRIALAELKDETFILPPADHMFEITLEHMFTKAGFTPKVRARVQQITLMGMVADGMGITVGLSTARSYDPKAMQECAAVPLRDSFCKLDVYLYWRPQAQYSQIYDDFLNYIKQHGADDILADT